MTPKTSVIQHHKDLSDEDVGRDDEKVPSAGPKEPMHSEQAVVDQAYKTLRANPSGVFDPGQASARELARMVLQNLGRYNPEIYAPDWTDRPSLSSAPATIIRSRQELSEDEINEASSEALRDAYRALRDHHVTETTPLGRST